MVRVMLAELLGKNKMSRNDLAKITGIRYNTINDLYHEIALGIKFEHIDEICKALNCNVNDLIDFKNSKK